MVKSKLAYRGENSFEKIYELKNKYNICKRTPIIAVSKEHIKHFQTQDYGVANNPLVEIIFEIRQKKTIKKLKYLKKTPYFGEFINNKLKGIKNEINIFIVSWCGKEGYEERDFFDISSRILDSLNYEKVINDNFITPPFTYLLKNVTYLDDGYRFMNNYIFPLINKLENTISKPENILGYVPLYFFEGEWLRNILEKYFDLGITKYLMDFGGKNIDTLKDRVFVLLEFKEKIEKEYGENIPILYYAFNTFRGQFRKRDEIPARDFLSLFTGFDILGSYSRRGLPPEALKNIDSSQQEFIRNRYTYRKSSRLSEKEIKKVNMDRKLKETINLKIELEKNGTFLNLLKNKPQEVKNIVDQIIYQERIDQKYLNLI